MGQYSLFYPGALSFLWFSDVRVLQFAKSVQNLEHYLSVFIYLKVWQAQLPK